ncbi:DUF4252 domain-containing protein [Salegentibacter sp. F188]|uniref:DUF4252 domain-containing protein n=1 Tax=Autumnicola patrickiae TaxID=3075591 RepID=A0ABU3E4T8_9FLAO|nr:DUF4252 domain-containing protein [Salegentibacter sp. F188]MDT0690252.1 DUF4252 domain-containing protein [Salegentibacter sp. F188]
MKIVKIISCLIVSLVLFSCNNEPTLQEYYVENQSDKEFLAIDLPVSMFANSEALNEDQRATLETVKKVNVLAYPVKDGNEKFTAEKAELENILKDESYQLLIRYGSGERGAEIYFTGDEEAIDEFIVFGYDNSKGMGVARVLGEDMNPASLLKLLKSMEEGDLNLEALSSIGDVFGEEKQIADSSEVKTDSVNVEIDAVEAAE